jgi:glycerol-3-phosphate dehydrogenase (NAD(P)+)
VWHPDKAKTVAKNLSNYIKTKITDDIIGTEYAAMLKNIYAIAAGWLTDGLGMVIISGIDELVFVR